MRTMLERDEADGDVDVLQLQRLLVRGGAGLMRGGRHEGAVRGALRRDDHGGLRAPPRNVVRARVECRHSPPSESFPAPHACMDAGLVHPPTSQLRTGRAQ